MASKAAVEGMTLILARELRGKDITVTPGPTATPLFLDGKSQREIDKLAEAVPQERLGTPDDIAETKPSRPGPPAGSTARSSSRTEGSPDEHHSERHRDHRGFLRVRGPHGRIDVLIHNAGHRIVGPTGPFTPEQLHDINVRSIQRVNRAVLPDDPLTVRVHA